MSVDPPDSSSESFIMAMVAAVPQWPDVGGDQLIGTAGNVSEAVERVVHQVLEGMQDEDLIRMKEELDALQEKLDTLSLPPIPEVEGWDFYQLRSANFHVVLLTVTKILEDNAFVQKVEEKIAQGISELNIRIGWFTERTDLDVSFMSYFFKIHKDLDLWKKFIESLEEFEDVFFIFVVLMIQIEKKKFELSEKRNGNPFTDSFVHERVEHANRLQSQSIGIMQSYLPIFAEMAEDQGISLLKAFNYRKEEKVYK